MLPECNVRVNEKTEFGNTMTAEAMKLLTAEMVSSYNLLLKSKTRMKSNT